MISNESSSPAPSSASADAVAVAAETGSSPAAMESTATAAAVAVSSEAEASSVPVALTSDSSSVVIEADDSKAAAPAPAASTAIAVAANPGTPEKAAGVSYDKEMDNARDAFKSNNIEASKAAHAAKARVGAPENHGGTGSEYIKSIVFGGIDGIATTISLAASMAGSDYTAGFVIAIGFAKLIGDAISMGVGDWLSESAEIKYIRSERAREEWEFNNYREGEIEEMVEIYQSKGFSKQDAEEVIRLMTSKDKYKDYFLDHMVSQELSLFVPDADAQPWKDGLVSFSSFVLFGAVPLLAYVITFAAEYHSIDGQLGIACALTAITLFALGAIQARIIKQIWWKQGFFMLIMGSAAAASAYGIGYGLQKAFGVQENEGC